MEEIIEKCPVCSNPKFELYTHIKDHKVSRETFKIDQCNNCGFLLTNPRPDENSIGKYYKSESYVSHTDSKKGLINFLYHQVRKVTLRKKLNWLNKYVPDKTTLLDVGCGTGYLLNTCKKDGWKVAGVEPDKGARKIAQESTGETVVESIDKIKGKFQVITLWHVLEHIHRLDQSFDEIDALLQEDGVMFIALPNYQCYDRKIYQEYWDGFEVPRHLYHFSQDTIAKFLDKKGYKIIDTKPMIFDAFYACMLSESYKNKGKINMPRAFVNGLKSNLKARKDNNYSAVLYIAKRK